MDLSKRGTGPSKAAEEGLKAFEIGNTGMNWGMKLIFTVLGKRQSIKLQENNKKTLIML